MSRIHVTIDRLSLPDGSAADRKALIAAFEAELRGILAQAPSREAWVRSRRTPVLRLKTGPMRTGPAGSGQFGVAMARAIGKGVKA